MPTTPTEVAQLWRRVNREVRELIRSTAKRDDLPPLTFPVLFHIQKEPGITVSELARKIGAAKSHISTLTDGLERDGYIEKQSDPSDQRLIRMYLTSAAVSLLNEHEERAQAMWAMVLQQLPEQDLEDLARFLRNLLAAFERAKTTYHAATAQANETSGQAAGDTPGPASGHTLGQPTGPTTNQST